MRNLKRVLSLALAAMMLIGMMVVGASAASYDDFTDKDEIVNTEAVQVLNSLGVIDGKEDGSFFDPTGNVTRAEMAKMITIICLGNVDVSAFQGTTTDLTDISTNWAEAYIKYCYSQGVIAGRGDGTFDPTANVTAVEAAKMLLVAIGYNSKVQVYEGSDWAINVTRDAQLSGFYEDLTVTSTKELTRDEAAQMIYNAVQAKTVEKHSSIDREDGTISDSYVADGDPLLEKTFGVVEAKGVMTATGYDSDKDEYSYTVAGEGTFKFASDVTNLFQQHVTVLYKVNKDNTKTVYGIYADKGSVVAEATLGDIDWDNYAADVADKIITIDGTEYDLTAADVTFYAMRAAADADETTASADAAKGYTMKAIDQDDDDKIDVIVYAPFTVAEVTYVGTTSITMDNGVGNKKLADIDVYSDVAKDDMVVVTAAANSAKNMITVEKATVVSGKVTAVKGSDISLDGTWYTLANDVEVTLGTEYDLTVVNGYVYAKNNVTSEVSVSDYVVVTNAQDDASWDADNAKAVLLFADGSTKTVDVKVAATKGKLVTYSVSDDVYELTAATADTTSTSDDYCGFDVADIASASYDTSKDKMTIAGKTYSVADDAVIFVQVNDDGDISYEVITGAQLKKLDNVTSVTAAYGTTNDSTGFTSVTMAYITTASTSASDDTAYGYVTAGLVAVQDKDKNTVYEITLGDGTVLTTKNGVSVAGIGKGSVISYKLTDGLVTTLTEIADTKNAENGVAITAYDGTVLTVDGDAKTYEVTDDTVILYIDSANSAVAEGGNVSLAVKDSSDNYVANAAIKAASSANSDGNYELDLLVVDVNNNFYNADII